MVPQQTTLSHFNIPALISVSILPSNNNPTVRVEIPALDLARTIAIYCNNKLLNCTALWKSFI